RAGRGGDGEASGAPIPVLGELRAAATPVAGARALVDTMARAAYGLEAPPVGDGPRQDLRVAEAAARVLDELDAWQASGEPVGPEDVVDALERTAVRGPSPSAPGAVAVVALMRARTRRL